MSRPAPVSAAFDVNPNPDKDVHALAIDEADPRPAAETLRATARFYRLTAPKINAIETQVRVAIADWASAARTLGAQAREIDAMQAVIDPQR